MVNVVAGTDITAVAEATEEIFKLINQLTNPDSQDRKFLKKKLKALYKFRSVALDMVSLADPIMQYQKTDKKLFKKWTGLVEDFNKLVKKT